MFSSPKFTDHKNSPKNSMHDTSNGFLKSFIQPKITSTPMRRDSIFATPPKPRHLSHHRYSLSDIATPPRTNRRENKKSSMYLNSTGPLLTSTDFNVNVSTYEDAKSPGLASRIVQYDNETKMEKEHKRPITHQAKYGSPGLFPVVHLFKNKLPILEQKPRKVSVRLASPDYSRFQSQEYNRKLLQGMIKPGIPTLGGHSLVQPNNDSSPSTRSVLDALKEISRKRIHASEEYELIEESGKRLRTDQVNGDTNKRLRDDSPLLETSTSPVKPISKRICVYDEYKASCSSSDFSLPSKEPCGSKRKSISISTSTENPKDSKLVKLINAETQTIIEASHKFIDVPAKSVEINKLDTENVAQESKQAKTSDIPPIKIFDDAPLERIRKNRLAALMGSLVGKDAVALTPKPDIANVLEEKPQAAETAHSETPKLLEKPLVSILTRNRSPQKSDKRVHFSIPDTSSQTTGSSVVSSLLDTPASTTVITVVSAPIKNTPISTRLETSTSSSTFLPTAAAASQVTFSSDTSLSASKQSISSSKDAPSSAFTIPTSNVQVTQSTPTTAISGSAFGANLVGFTIPTVQKPATCSPPKSGGFKFDLNKPAAPATATAAPATATATNNAFSFGNATAKTVTSSNALFGGNTVTSTKSASRPLNAEQFSFGSKTSSGVINTATTTASSFGTPISSISASATTFNFGSNVGDTTKKPEFENPTTTKGNFGTPTTQTSFGTPTTSSSFGTPTTRGSFGTPTTQSSFGTPTTVNSFGSPTTRPSFGTPTTQSSLTNLTTQTNVATPVIQSGFAVSTVASNFGNAADASSTPQFGSATSKPVFSFGSSTNAVKPLNTSPFAFSASTTSAITNTKTTGLATVTTTSAFGTSTIPSNFGASAASSSFDTTMSSGGFGKPTVTSAFGTTTNSGSFGVSTKPGGGLFGGSNTTSFGTSTTTTTSSAFGNSATSTTSPFGSINSTGFGKSSPFGSVATTASFGVVNTLPTTNAPPLFGGKTTTNAFGTTSGGFGTQQPATTNIFGGTTVTPIPSFGAPNNNTVFGSVASAPFGSSATTTSNAAFGSNATPAFTFGAKTTTNMFGSHNTFGVTTASNGFGTTPTPSFGNSNSFGTSSTSFPANSSFGPATTTHIASFGTTNTPSFGAASGGFGAPGKAIFGNSTTSAFEANSTTPAFGATAPNSGFGAPNNAHSFGSNTSSAFAKPHQTTNSFRSTSNSFGTNNSFGSNPQQGQAGGGFNSSVSTTQAPVFNFAGAASQPTVAKPTGVFSFGASAAGDPPKPSFNFTGGNTAPPAFSGGVNTGTPAFGAGGAPSFGATPQPATAGVFNIGAGPPTAGRARTQLKAKRRT